MSEHVCAVCPDCIHDGRKCCGCYDGACCQAPAGLPLHEPTDRDASDVPSDRLATYAEAIQAIDLIVRRFTPEAVIHLDAETLAPVGVSKPCPATTTARLGFKSLSGVRVPCGHLVGHDGPHVFHVEWTDPEPTDAP